MLDLALARRGKAEGVTASAGVTQPWPKRLGGCFPHSRGTNASTNTRVGMRKRLRVLIHTKNALTHSAETPRAASGSPLTA